MHDNSQKFDVPCSCACYSSNRVVHVYNYKNVSPFLLITLIITTVTTVDHDNNC
jgi:hypothetical protein